MNLAISFRKSKESQSFNLETDFLTDFKSKTHTWNEILPVYSNMTFQRTTSKRATNLWRSQILDITDIRQNKVGILLITEYSYQQFLLSNK